MVIVLSNLTIFVNSTIQGLVNAIINDVPAEAISYSLPWYFNLFIFLGLLSVVSMFAKGGINIISGLVYLYATIKWFFKKIKGKTI